MEQIYIVVKTKHDYPETWDHNVKAFASKEVAEKYAARYVRYLTLVNALIDSTNEILDNTDTLNLDHESVMHNYDLLEKYGNESLKIDINIKPLPFNNTI